MSKESKPKSQSTASVESFSLAEIGHLLDLLDKHEVSEFKLERGDDKIWLRRGNEQEQNNYQPPSHIHINSGPALSGTSSAAPQQNANTPAAPGEPGAPRVPQSAAPAEPVPAVEPKKAYKEVSSPMVGTFYRRPAVDADPYVEVGDSVKKGDVLCIVEAMKLMNEIESDVTGVIVEICLDDGQMVEYGEVLFRIEPS